MPELTRTGYTFKEWNTEADGKELTDGTNMEAEITREQLATMLYRYAQFKGYDVSAAVELIAFTDGDQVSGWAEDTMKWAAPTPSYPRIWPPVPRSPLS